MKRFLVVLVTLLFAAGAYAQQTEEKKAEFTYGITAIAFGTYGTQADLVYDYSHKPFYIF